MLKRSNKQKDTQPRQDRAGCHRTDAEPEASEARKRPAAVALGRLPLWFFVANWIWLRLPPRSGNFTHRREPTPTEPIQETMP
jgi:hypothetical protein